MGRAVGIDLGTTYSAVAVVDDNGYPTIVPTARGSRTTPSVVLFESVAGADAPLVGSSAKDKASTRTDDVVQYVKRHMGDPSWRFDSATGAQYRPEEVSAIILRALVHEAEQTLGEPIHDVVITVPAYFDDSRRTATKHAGTIAGLNVLRVLNEPTAAALSFGISTDEDGIVLVYDLGGGTFDVTILGIEGTAFAVLATDGDRNLGGFDWDNAIMKYVVSELESAHLVTDIYDDIDAVAALREAAEEAKRALSSAGATEIAISYRGERYTVPLSREKFEALTKSLLRRTQDLVEDTLDASGLEWDDISSVLLVGGSTRMPAVRALVRRLSGREAADGVDPDEAVALGAAIQAALESTAEVAPASIRGVTIADVTSHALGTIALDDDDQPRNFVVIDKNTEVPAAGSRVLATVRPATELYVTITQGDDPDLEFTTEIGSGVITLEEEWPADTHYALIYRYDVDQTVNVEVYRLPDELAIGSFAIDRVANLDAATVEKAAEKLASLPIGVAAPPAPARTKPTLAPLRAPILQTQTLTSQASQTRTEGTNNA